MIIVIILAQSDESFIGYDQSLFINETEQKRLLKRGYNEYIK